MAFGIPEDRPEHWKVEGWRQSLDQCTSLHQVIEMECRLYATLKWAVRNNVPTPLLPTLSRMCVNRWNEIAAQLGIETRRKS